MSKLTRNEVSEILNISTRSIDRYIKSGRLRSEKIGKVVYINKDDVETLANGGINNQEIIMENKNEKSEIKEKAIEKNEKIDNFSIELIFNELKNEINKKDDVIQELALRLGRAEEIAKNSISLIEYKKSQFLLEESKGHLNKKVEDLENSNIKLSLDLKYEKNTNIILILSVIVLLVIAGILRFYKI